MHSSGIFQTPIPIHLPNSLVVPMITSHHKAPCYSGRSQQTQPIPYFLLLPPTLPQISFFSITKLGTQLQDLSHNTFISCLYSHTVLHNATTPSLHLSFPLKLPSWKQWKINTAFPFLNTCSRHIQVRFTGRDYSSPSNTHMIYPDRKIIK